MTKALYNKWRPQKWEDVVGQQHIIQTLRNAVSRDRVVHAYLFAGPRGTGKTTTARLLAKAVNCLDPDPGSRPCNKCAHCKAVNEGSFLDLIEIDAASTNSVEDVRDWRDKINFSPNQGTYKIYIIDEVQMLSTSAFNALLKTLEEPPPHAIFILATTEIHKIPATVLSRCQRHEFRRVSVDDTVAQLKRIVEAEHLRAEPAALTLIARQSSGGMRDAISLLDQMASTGSEISLTLTQTVLGTTTSQTVLDLMEAILKKEPAGGMDVIHTALDAGSDPRLLARQVVDYLRSLLLIQMGNRSQVDMPGDVMKEAERHAASFSQGEVLRMIKAFNQAAVESRGGWQPALPLEMALAGLMETPGSIPAAPVPVEKKSAGKPPMESQSGRESPKESPAPPATMGEDAKPATGQDGENLSKVMKAWKQISGEFKTSDPELNGLLNSSRPVDVRRNEVMIGFPSEILRSKVDIPERLEKLHQAVLKTAGVDLKVKCVISTTKHAVPADIRPDGMVAAALKNGGEIVDTQE